MMHGWPAWSPLLLCLGWWMSSSVARSVTQIGFTIAGNVIGGPIGGAIGSALGAAIAYELFPPDPVKGPRLADLKAQVSSYGGSIPRAWGAVRMAGNVIWASDLIETEKTEEVGGKGGGPDVTTYSYSINCAVGICVGPIAGIRKIWADTELVYDVSDQADIEAQQASKDFSQWFTLYTGTTTQMPDATMESALGAGNVPGYRGLAYIVFTGLPLERYGNRLPNLEFEIISSGTVSTPDRIANISITPVTNHGSLLNGLMPVIFPGRGTVRIGNNADNLVRVYSAAGTFLQLDSRTPVERAWPVLQINNSTRGGYGLGASAQLWGRVRSGTLKGVLEVRTTSLAQYDCMGLLSNAWLTSMVPCADQSAFLAFSAAGQSATPTTWDLLEWGAGGVSVVRSGTVPAGVAASVTDYVFGNTGTAFGDGTTFQAGCLESDRTHFWIGTSAGGNDPRCLRLEDDGTITVVQVFNTVGTVSTLEAFATPTAFADSGYFYWAGGSKLNIYHRGGALVVSTVTLSTVVQEIGVAAGYQLADLNTAGLTDAVVGYGLSQSAAARGALDQLRASFFFDVVESDGTLKFVKRGGAAAATLSVDELGVIDQPGPLNVQRAQETELPSRINVAYLAADADYQVGTQSARRETTGSRSVQDVQLAVAMTDLHAAQIADVLLTDAWLARESRSAVAPAKYAYIEPTDVVQIVDTDGTVFTCRVTETKLAGQRVDLTLVDDRAAMYTSQALAGLTPGGQSVGLAGPTGLHVLDLPPLREQDGGSGLYYAAYGFTSRWRGAQVFVESDGNYEATAVATTGARVGVCTTTLGSFSGINQFDESNVLRVQVNGTLSSVSRTQALAGANAAVVGDEVIVFRNATLVSAGIYDLTGLLRGRLGTERFIATHAAGERFVLLTVAGLNRGPLSYTRLGQVATFKAVTFGDALADSPEYEITFQAASIRPYAPVRLACVPQSSGDLAFKWVRRARLANDWADGADVPLDEVSESYTVEIYNGSTLVRTATAASPAWTYSASARNADGLGANTSLGFAVYQMSATVGRGFAASETFTVPPADSYAIQVLLHLNGANGSTTITDTSLNPRTFTCFGGCSISTTQSVFGGASLSFNGTTGYLVGTSVAAPGAGDFTLEFRLRVNSLGAAQVIFDGRATTSSSTGWALYLNASAVLQIFSGNADRLSGGTTIAANTWYAVAVVRSGSSVLVYLNGALVETWSNVSLTFSDTRFELGRDLGNFQFLGGFIDELRYTRGIARYTGASYTVAGAAFPDPVP